MIYLTAAQWAERPDLRAELAQALAIPAVAAALDTLERGGFATMVVPPGFPSNMDALTAMALTNAQRAGGLNFLKTLRGLPHLENSRMAAIRAASDPATELTPTA